MIPSADIDVVPAFPVHLAMGLPAPDEVDEEGYGYFRDVWAIGEVGREEARAMIEEERRLVSLVDQASRNEVEFDCLAQAIEKRELEYLPVGYAEQYPDSELVREASLDSDEGVPLEALELGVAGLSYALTSIGCFTAASCRSHSGEHPWADRPVIFFAAERDTVRWLTPLVAESGCGLGDGSERAPKLLVLEAPSITNFMNLARCIVQRVER
ncbi:hypothetical protein ACF07M_00755 [Streptomyces globisporus]|uniref:hypothetical protein n=1 Tax=Streptomyces TaxID=1883 RepID=UPI001008660E|nr:hypothetical protein [Streptomyces sp. S063]